MIKLCVFDFDSTLVQNETIDELATSYGVFDKVKDITDRVMSGEIDFFEGLQARVNLLRGMKLDDAFKVCKSIKLTNGAKEVVNTLKQKGIKVIVLSGGFDLAIDYFKDIIGYDESFSNTLHHKDGILSGLIGGEMMFSHSKGKMIRRIQKLLDIAPNETICVGDGANDISMFAYSKISVAFCAKQVLKQYSTHCVDISDMREILKIIG